MRMARAARIIVAWMLALVVVWGGSDTRPARAAAAGEAAELRVAMVAVTGRQRSALVSTMELFERANPGIAVRFDQIEHENYKERFASFAREGRYDAMFWFAGDQLEDAVANDLVDKMIDVPFHWEWVNLLPPQMLDTARVGATVFGLPISAHNIGLFYYKPLFERLGLQPPTNWAEFESVSNRLKAEGIAPVALGSRFPWTAALWFDYLNLRVNGARFHREQLQGRQSFDDPRTRKVLELWAEMIRKGWFQPDHASYDWRSAVPGLLRQQTGMMLMGNYMISQVSPQQRENIGYVRFPLIDATVPVAENAPTDLIVVPKAARNKTAAGRFVAFMAQPEIQARFNLNIGQLPARRDAELPDDPLLRAGAQSIAQAVDVTQQFDRDARPAIRDAGLTAFATFMADPSRIEETIRALESARVGR